MRQISLEQVLELCKKNDFELLSTHPSLSLPIIERMYRKMVFGIQFPNIKVEGNIIVNGHHRYLASLLAGVAIERSPSINPPANHIIAWESVLFEENDWDSEAAIIRFNEEDARYNDLSYEEICNLLR